MFVSLLRRYIVLLQPKPSDMSTDKPAHKYPQKSRHFVIGFIWYSLKGYEAILYSLLQVKYNLG